MRDLLQKTVFLALNVQKLTAHPIEPCSQIFEVLGAVDHYGQRELAIPEVADCRINLADRTYDEQRETADQKQNHWQQRQSLPQHDTLRVDSRLAHCLHLPIDELPALGHYQLCTVREVAEAA